MRRQSLTALLIAAILLSLASANVLAGAKIQIDENSSIELGLRLQTLYIVSEEDIDDDGKYETTQDFNLRRGRIRLKGTVGPYVSGFLQTETGSKEGGGGADARIIDAYITVKPDPRAQLMMGEHMAPASRQNLTSSAALLAIDRPGMNYKTLTWGTRALSRFATTTIEECDAGLRGDVDVRDTGATLFGHHSFADEVHGKYYLGAYDGIQKADEDNNRYTARVQVNLFDPEDKYFNSSTYLGKKKTVGVGIAYDMQQDVQECPRRGTFDYNHYTVDLFLEWPLGEGTVTFETAYQNLNLDDALPLLDEEGNPLTHDPRQSQGEGFYAQAGYYIKQWQPWVEFEQWDSDGEGGKGGYDLCRVGLSYFIKGQHANIKAGYEFVDAEVPFGSTNEDTINTFVLGLYLTY